MDSEQVTYKITKVNGEDNTPIISGDDITLTEKGQPVQSYMSGGKKRKTNNKKTGGKKRKTQKKQRTIGGKSFIKKQVTEVLNYSKKV
jgi:hypothetical protein